MRDKKQKERITEKEFLMVWGKNHPKPEENEKRKEWELERQKALGHWLVEKELERNDSEQKKEKEEYHNRVKRHVNNHILRVQYDMHVAMEPCFLPGAVPYTREMFEMRPLIMDMEVMTAIAQIEELERLDHFVNIMGEAIGRGLSEEACDAICKDILQDSEQEYVTLRQESQCGRQEKVVEGVQSAIHKMIQGSLSSDWNYNRTIRFLGDQMSRVFYDPQLEKNEEIKQFRQKFKEADTGKELQAFLAIRRITELSALYQQSVVKLREKSKEKEFFTPQELRDFLVGSYVANEIKKIRAQKKITKEALRLGEVTVHTNETGGSEFVYGDEKLYQEMKKSETYRILSRMRIGEIRKMLNKENEVEAAPQKETKAVETKQVNTNDRVMVLKPHHYD